MNNNVKKILLWSIIALLLFFLISKPQETASWLKGGLIRLRDAAEQIVLFFKGVFT